MGARERPSTVPIIPPRPMQPLDPSPYDPNPVVARCGRCGLGLQRVMGYVCPYADCPTGLGSAQL